MYCIGKRAESDVELAVTISPCSGSVVGEGFFCRCQEAFGSVFCSLLNLTSRHRACGTTSASVKETRVTNKEDSLPNVLSSQIAVVNASEY